jgi:hypothetical protein
MFIPNVALHSEIPNSVNDSDCQSEKPIDILVPSSLTLIIMYIPYILYCITPDAQLQLHILHSFLGYYNSLTTSFPAPFQSFLHKATRVTFPFQDKIPTP